MYRDPHVKYPLFLSDFVETRIFVTDFYKIMKYQIPWKSVLWEPSFPMHTDDWTDKTTLSDGSCDFVNMPEMWELKESFIVCLFEGSAD
jgi:hypothetical protein